LKVSGCRDIHGTVAKLGLSALILLPAILHPATGRADSAPDAKIGAWTAERRLALAAATEQAALTRGIRGGFVAVDLTLGASLLLGLAFETDAATSRDDEALAVGVSAIWLGGGLASIYLDDHDRGQALAATALLAGLGTGSLGLAFSGEWRRQSGEIFLSDRRHDGFLIAGVALGATAAALAVDDLVHPIVSPSRMSRDHARIATPARRERISVPELEAIERRLRRSTTPTSRWLLMSPLLVGAAVVAGRGAVEEHDGEQTLDFVLAGGLAAQGLLVALMPVRRHLKVYDRQAHVGLGPAGIQVNGRF
jgi:hypothetical protein